MKELQEIWDSNMQDLDHLTDNSIDRIIERKSSLILANFRRTLWIELILSLIIMVSYGIFYRSIYPAEISLFVILSAAVTLFMNSYALHLFKKMNINLDTKMFLKLNLKFLYYFILSFLVSIHILLVIVVVLINYYFGYASSWFNFIKSDIGIKTLLLVIFVDLVLILYARRFYISKYFELKGLLKNFNK